MEKNFKETLKLYEQIHNGFDEAVMFFDIENRIQLFNKVAYERLSTVIGKPLEKGMSLNDYLPKSLGDAFYADFKKCLSGIKVHFERIVKYSEDQSFYVLVSMHPIYDENNSIIGVLSYSIDITERKIAEEKNKIAENKLMSILNSTIDSHILVDPKYKVVSFNKVANQRTKLSIGVELMEGENFMDYVDENRKEKFIQDFQQALSGKKIFNDELHIIKEQKRWYQFRFIPVHDLNGNISGIALNSINITTLKERNEKIKKFSFLTSHKLRHEFSKILMMIESVKNDDMKQEGLVNFFKEVELASGKMNEVFSELSQNFQGISDNAQKSHIPLSSLDEICLIDDDPLTNFLNSKIIGNTLPHIPFIIFEDVDEALKYVKDKPFVNRTIFLDLNLGEKSGWEFLDEYKTLEKGEHSSVVILSSSIDPDDYLKSKNYPEVSLFCTKPLNKAMLESLK